MPEPVPQLSPFSGPRFRIFSLRAGTLGSLTEWTDGWMSEWTEQVDFIRRQGA